MTKYLKRGTIIIIIFSRTKSLLLSIPIHFLYNVRCSRFQIDGVTHFLMWELHNIFAWRLMGERVPGPLDRGCVRVLVGLKVHFPIPRSRPGDLNPPDDLLTRHCRQGNPFPSPIQIFSHKDRAPVSPGLKVKDGPRIPPCKVHGMVLNKLPHPLTVPFGFAELEGHPQTLGHVAADPIRQGGCHIARFEE